MGHTIVDGPAQCRPVCAGHISGATHPLEMSRRMASATVTSGSAQNPQGPSLFLTHDLFRGGGLLLLLSLRVGFGLLL
jgi:hypothetical protein